MSPRKLKITGAQLRSFRVTKKGQAGFISENKVENARTKVRCTKDSECSYANTPPARESHDIFDFKNNNKSKSNSHITVPYFPHLFMMYLIPAWFLSGQLKDDTCNPCGIREKDSAGARWFGDSLMAIFSCGTVGDIMPLAR